MCLSKRYQIRQFPGAVRLFSTRRIYGRECSKVWVLAGSTGESSAMCRRDRARDRSLDEKHGQAGKNGDAQKGSSIRARRTKRGKEWEPNNPRD